MENLFGSDVLNIFHISRKEKMTRKNVLWGIPPPQLKIWMQMVGNNLAEVISRIYIAERARADMVRT